MRLFGESDGFIYELNSFWDLIKFILAKIFGTIIGFAILIGLLFLFF